MMDLNAPLEDILDLIKPLKYWDSWSNDEFVDPNVPSSIPFPQFVDQMNGALAKLAGYTNVHKDQCVSGDDADYEFYWYHGAPGDWYRVPNFLQDAGSAIKFVKQALPGWGWSLGDDLCEVSSPDYWRPDEDNGEDNHGEFDDGESFFTTCVVNNSEPVCLIISALEALIWKRNRDN